jgi:hypothetical protein
MGLQLQRVGRKLPNRRTKNEASDAPLPLPAVCVTALRQRLADVDQVRTAVGSVWQHTGLVFCTALLGDLDVPASGDEDPAACPVLGDDGDLHAGVVEGDAGSAQAAR